MDFSEIMAYVGSNWLEWLCTALAALAAMGYKSLSKKMKEERKRNEAIAEGVKSLLRESIVSAYNKYSDRGFCPIYAKESMRRVYEAYHGLGGNDVASSLYQKILQMPEDPPRRAEDDPTEDDLR